MTTDDQTEQFAREVQRITAGVQSFAEEMRAKGIHVGLGARPLARCVTCDEPWPCKRSAAKR